MAKGGPRYDRTAAVGYHLERSHSSTGVAHAHAQVVDSGKWGNRLEARRDRFECEAALPAIVRRAGTVGANHAAKVGNRRITPRV